MRMHLLGIQRTAICVYEYVFGNYGWFKRRSSWNWFTTNENHFSITRVAPGLPGTTFLLWELTTKHVGFGVFHARWHHLVGFHLSRLEPQQGAARLLECREGFHKMATGKPTKIEKLQIHNVEIAVYHDLPEDLKKVVSISILELLKEKLKCRTVKYKGTTGPIILMAKFEHLQRLPLIGQIGVCTLA